MDTFKGFKTVIFNVIMVLAAMMTLLTGADTVDDAIVLKEGADQMLQGIIVVWGVGAIWLRTLTNTAIFSRKSSTRY